jgi:glycosyltransferase involved in cell wall biosynthesis
VKRVFFLDHTAVLGGGEIALLHLTRHLDPARFQPIVGLLSNGPLADELAGAGVRTVLIDAGSELVQARKDALSPRRAIRSALPAIRRIARQIEQVDADLVHCNSLKTDLLGGIAARWAGRPVIWHIRDRISRDYLPAAAVALVRTLAMAIPTHIVANSQATLDTLRLFDETAASVIYSGLDLDPYLHIAPKRTGPTRIGLIGRLAPWKGQHIFLQAAALLRRKFPAATFQIVGSPLFSETDYEKSLHQLARALGIAEATEFTGFRADIPALLEQMDVVVHASVTAEPFGQVAVLAMAAGKPLVATAGGGILEIVEREKTGLLVPMGDAAAMAAAICRLLANPHLAAQLGRAARRRAGQLFTIQRTAAQMMDLYDRITA